MATIYTNDESRTEIDYDDLKTQLNVLYQIRNDLEPSEETFVVQMYRRILEYGANLYISKKQFDWLSQIEEKYTS